MSEEILSFEIIIDAKLSDETKETLNQLKHAEEQDTTAQGDEDDPLTTSETSETLDDVAAAERLEEFIRNTDKNGMKVLSSFAKNPTAMVEGQLMKALAKAGIYGLIAAAIIALVLAAPDLIKTITNALAVKGGPLNQDFHRFFDEETERGIARDIQYRYAVGLDVIITNYERKYILTDPNFVTSNLVDIDTTRMVRLTTQDIQYGYVSTL